MAAPDLLPGDYVQLSHAYLDESMSPILGEGGRALVISTGGVFASSNEALILADDRLITVPDWWLRLHCNVLNDPTSERPCPGHVATPLGIQRCVARDASHSTSTALRRKEHLLRRGSR